MMGSATMEIINGTISNPTCNSIDMTSTVKIQNTGMFGATVHGAKVNILSDGIPFGYINLPTIHITGNPPNIVSMDMTLVVTNNTQFKNSIKGLMDKHNEHWMMQSAEKHKIDATVMGMTLTTYAKFSKKMTLTGSEFIGAKTSNFKVAGLNDGSSDELITTADTEFYSTSKFFIRLPVNTRMDFYYNDRYFGYTLLNNRSNELKPGWNKLIETAAIIDRSDHNEDVIQDFFKNYMKGDEQFLHLRGPVVHYEDDKHHLYDHSGHDHDCKQLVINDIVDIALGISGSGGFGQLLDQLNSATMKFFLAGLNPFN